MNLVVRTLSRNGLILVLLGAMFVLIGCSPPPDVEDTTIYTPNGTAVSALKVNTDFTSSEKQQADDWIEANYPNATILRSATMKYNCHSYAWHNQSASNNIWLNSPGDDQFWLDGSYSLAPSEPVNSKVSYCADDHSAIKASSSKFKSKWGQFGLIEHSPSYAPYDSSCLNYYN